MKSVTLSLLIVLSASVDFLRAEDETPNSVYSSFVGGSGGEGGLQYLCDQDQEQQKALLNCLLSKVDEEVKIALKIHSKDVSTLITDICGAEGSERPSLPSYFAVSEDDFEKFLIECLPKDEPAESANSAPTGA
uniref:Putative secreted protein n=1 Tax=Amblyomma triste TaxID=251400 RepID=A0A023G0X8_AMBTT